MSGNVWALVLVAAVAAQSDTSILIRGDALIVDAGGVSLPMRFDSASAATGTIELRSRDGAKWVAAVTTEQLDAVRNVQIPPGAYDLSLHVAHHRHVYVSIVAGATHSDAPPVIRIPAAPVIAGSVTRGSSALAGARVTLLPSGGTVTTDVAGRFQIEVEERWPEALSVSHRGLGTVRVEVPAAEASVTLPPVMMARSATIRVKLGRAVDGPVTAELTKRNEEIAESTVVSVKRFDRGSRVVVFDDVAAGSYVVLLRGTEPLQCVGTRAGVAAGDMRTLEVLPSARLMRIRVVRGEAPFANARVILNSIVSGCTSAFIADANGEIESEVWERGWYETGVRDDSSSAPFVGRLVLEDARPLLTASDVTIAVPDRRVRGRVVDPSGAPVAGALLTLRSGEAATTIRARTNESGQFVYTAAHAGRQVLSVFAPGFLRPEPIELTLADGERTRDVHVQLQRGHARAVEIVDLHGAPLASALIVCAEGLIVRSVAFADTHGRADVATPLDRASKLYVIPNEGSLAVRTTSARENDIVRIEVPAGSASLEISTRTTDDAPLPDIGFLMRYNGELIPPSVAREMHRYQGIQLGTNENGTAMLRHIPPGAYELWPYRTEEEAASILDIALEAPINVNVVTGANKATVRFRKRP